MILAICKIHLHKTISNSTCIQAGYRYQVSLTNLCSAKKTNFMTFLWEGSYYAFVISIPLKMWLALLADDSEH